MHKNSNNLSKKILSWYDNNKRILPWRITKKSQRQQYYRILSEFMLQQTQVRTVIPYFENFVQKIPNLKILSNCSEKKILKLWEGLGYYRRAKNLRKTAKILIDKYKGKLPINFEEIIKLPGIGEYTANVLLALVYNQPRIAFDGNVKRVFSRVFAIDLEKSKKRIEKIIVRKFLTNRNGDLAEALMEFGSHICKPNNPLCFSCALKNNCKYHKGKKYLPIKKQRYEKKKNIIFIVI